MAIANVVDDGFMKRKIKYSKIKLPLVFKFLLLSSGLYFFYSPGSDKIKLWIIIFDLNDVVYSGITTEK